MLRAAATLALCAAPALVAQLPRIEPGLRVRVAAPVVLKRPVTGTFMTQRDDTVHVAVSGTIHHSIPSVSVMRLDVSLGQSRSLGLLRGGATGAAVVGLTGATLTFALADWEGITMGDRLGVAAGWGAFWGMFGAAIGGAYGLAVGSERWVRVYPPVPREAP